jgi:hypothetical protein
LTTARVTLFRAAIVVAVMATASTALAQDPPNVVQAREHLARGNLLLEQQNFDAALTEFQTAYDIVGEHPVRHVILFNIGKAHERMFRYDLALEYYERYLVEGGPEATDRATVQATIATLQGLLATLDIQTNVASAEVWVDNRHVGTAPGDVRVDGGQHNIELRARGYAPGRRALQIAARTHETISLELDRVSAGISPAFFISGAALTAIAAGIGVGFGAVALGEQATINAHLSDDEQRFQVTQAQIDGMQQMALIADIFYGAALVFGVASAVLIFVTDWGGSAPPPESAFLLAPFATDTAAGLAAEGRF